MENVDALIAILQYAALYRIQYIKIESLQKIVVVSQELFLVLESDKDSQQTQIFLLALLRDVAGKISEQQDISDIHKRSAMWMSVSHEVVMRILLCPFYRGQDIFLSCLTHSVFPLSMGTIVEDVETQARQEIELCSLIASLLVELPEFEDTQEEKRDALMRECVSVLGVAASTEHGRNVLLQSDEVLSRLICCCSAQLDELYLCENTTTVKQR